LHIAVYLDNKLKGILIMSDRIVRNPLFDLSGDEISERLKAVVMRALNEREAQNLPLVYRTSLCTRKNQFIHEYPDGRTYLIQQNSNNSEERVIRSI